MNAMTDVNPAGRAGAGASETPARSWGIAATLGVALGAVFAWLIAGALERGPMSRELRLFLILWSPLSAAAAGGYLHWAAGARVSTRWAASLAALAVMTAVAAAGVWRGSEAVSGIAYLHLPAAAWFATGWWLVRRPAGGEEARERACADGASYLLKSAEAAATAAAFMAGVFVFAALTRGIFSALDVQVPEEALVRFAVFCAGAVAVLSVASVYRPGVPLSEQELDSGLMRLFRLAARILILPAIGVLLVYVGWFVPNAFDRAFRDREVLIAFHATIFAVLALLLLALPGERENLASRWRANLRIGLAVLATLTIALNAYALTAVLSRALRFGLTPNRHAVAGWGLVTLAGLIVTVASLTRGTAEDWPRRMRHSLMRIMPAAAVWTLWVIAACLWIG
jgi:hypothetical protein